MEQRVDYLVVYATIAESLRHKEITQLMKQKFDIV